MVIATVSGGLASAWCAEWALRNFPKEQVVLYFNDTKWEHPDLYRFLNDLEAFLDHPITRDNNGMSPEDLFYKHHAIPNSRMPFCSRVLKAEMLQKFYKDGDTLVFGIGADEARRATRILQVYQLIATKKKKWCTLRFPLIEENITRENINAFMARTGIRPPILYEMGFTHNNCSGGCVRAGKAHWAHLLKMLPGVYAERERAENKFREKFKKDVHILKDITLTDYREKIQRGILESPTFNMGDAVECVGICNTES